MAYSRINLKEVERRAFRSTFEDGLWDFFLGAIFLGFPLSALLDTFGLSETATILFVLGYNLLTVILFWLAKRFITMPRLGTAKFGRARIRRVTLSRLVLAASALLGVAVWLISSGSGVSVDGVLILFAVNIVVVFGLMAYFLDFDRLYAYAGLWALSMPAGAFLQEHAGLGDATYLFFLTGGLAVVVGVVLFVRFLKTHPSVEDAPHDRPEIG